MMRRREFMTLLGGMTGAVLPFTAWGQQPGKLPTIGFLGTASASAWSRWVPAFTQRLRELGWTDGHTVVVEYRWAEGREDRYRELLAEFVQLKVDVIVTGGGALPAAKQATSTIPIVFALAGDPVRSGGVASWARPGGNVTGLSSSSPELAGKRVELLRQVVPNLRRLAIMANVGYPSAAMQVKEFDTGTRMLGLEALTFEIRHADEIVSAFDQLKGRADALYVPADPLVNSNRVRINTLALGARLPTMFTNRGYVAAGGLMSYGPNVPEMFKRAADYVDKVLRGTKPADLPIEEPTKFDLVINLITAKAIGLKISESFLLRADEVIE